jgi:tetratricopeptide (TPR) repeat protein
MNHAFFPTILLLLAINASIGQNSRLVGLITYQNTGEPVGGVAVTPTEGANSTTSNDIGQFQLDFSGKTPGDMVKMILTKDQYRVVGVDPMIVEVALRQEADDLLRIVMVKKSEYAQRQDKYVKAIEKQLSEKDKEIQFYRSQLTESELTDAERRGLTQQIGTLTEELERLENNKEELAKRLAQVDLDQASAFAREALEAFGNGELDQALALMEDEKLDGFWENVLEQEEKVKQAKEQGVENYMIKARILSADGQFEEAFQNFSKAIERDSSNVDNLRELADFCGELNQQKRAINFYQQALRYSQAESEKASLLNNLGNQLKNNNQYERADRKSVM